MTRPPITLTRERIERLFLDYAPYQNKAGEFADAVLALLATAQPQPVPEGKWSVDPESRNVHEKSARIIGPGDVSIIVFREEMFDGSRAQAICDMLNAAQPQPAAEVDDVARAQSIVMSTHTSMELALAIAAEFSAVRASERERLQPAAKEPVMSNPICNCRYANDPYKAPEQHAISCPVFALAFPAGAVWCQSVT